MEGSERDMSSPNRGQFLPSVTDLQVVFNAAEFMLSLDGNLLGLEGIIDTELLVQCRERVMEAEETISYFDDEYLQAALGIPDDEIRNSLAELEKMTQEYGEKNRRRVVFYMPNLMLIMCSGSVNEV